MVTTFEQTLPIFLLAMAVVLLTIVMLKQSIKQNKDPQTLHKVDKYVFLWRDVGIMKNMIGLALVVAASILLLVFVLLMKYA